VSKKRQKPNVFVPKKRRQRLNRWIRNYQNSLHSMAQPHSPPFKRHLGSISQLF
jgi:hypothetical protein